MLINNEVDIRSSLHLGQHQSRDRAANRRSSAGRAIIRRTATSTGGRPARLQRHQSRPTTTRTFGGAINYAINRDEIVKIGYQGRRRGVMPLPRLSGLRPFTDGIADLPRSIRSTTSTLTRARPIMTAKGYAKDSAASGAKDGNRLAPVLITFSPSSRTSPRAWSSSSAKAASTPPSRCPQFRRPDLQRRCRRLHLRSAAASAIRTLPSACTRPCSGPQW